jgi:protein-L-isoaspartate(D-aspartate) O-methyltransferase
VIPDWKVERRKMVEVQLRRRGIHSERVLAAMGAIPREEFVPLESRVVAYSDAPVGIGCGQTISQPYMTGLMAAALELRGHERVLEVGSGSGYAAAVLGAIAREVVTVEIVPELARMARATLRRSGRDANVKVIEGDGGWGYAEGAPYDAISVAAAAPDVPATLLDQLRDPGVLVIPVGSREDQELRVIAKRDGRIQERIATLCRFVPLRGGEGWR